MIEAACRIAHQGEIVLLFQPTKELIEKTITDQLLRRSNPPEHKAFYGASPGQSIARKLTEYLESPMDGGNIVFATHQVMPFVRFWANKNQLHVFIDEELQVMKHGYFRIPHTHELITRHLDLGIHNAIYSRVVVNDPIELTRIAKNTAKDEIYERFRETAQTLTSEHWEFICKYRAI